MINVGEKTVIAPTMPETFNVTLDGAMLRRGYYLYVWEISPPDGNKVLYVGRTGDSSSPNAQSLFNRLGQNLGTLATSSTVRNNLENVASTRPSAGSTWWATARSSRSRQRRPCRP